MENSNKPSRFKIKKFKSFPTFNNSSIKYKSSFRSLNLSHDNQYGVRNIIATKAVSFVLFILIVVIRYSIIDRFGHLNLNLCWESVSL